MQESPETRDSLIARVRDPSDVRAWDEFVAIYRPVVYRLARKRGLQDADAQDLAQQVMLAVAKAIPRWESDREGGRFRHWLARVARNAILNALTRVPRVRASGGTTQVELLREHAQSDEASREAVELEYRREMFRRAARAVRDEVEPVTWQAFFLTTVGGQGVEETASMLGKSVGSVYAARSRVMRRLRDKVREWEE